MRVVRSLLALTLLLSVDAPLQAQSAEAIARLEEARQAEPENVAALRSLGIAYYKKERFADASTVLEQARKLAPKDGISALYAGLSAERVPDYLRARAAYDQYLGIKRPWYSLRARRTATQVRNRLLALAHEESVARAKAAVAAEAELSRTPGDPRTIAVPAMKYSGPNVAELAPLERGLAELVITDLSKSKQLTLVERDRMQALADEIQLGTSGNVDASSAARAGQLLQAGRLVNGSIVQGGTDLTLASSIVTVATVNISEPAQVTGSQDKFFDLQKDLVYRIFAQLGITLSEEERAAIGERQTSNFDAFLLYSRGLVASDAGRYAEAAALFNQAAALDPSFTSAALQASTASAAVAGAAVTPSTIETALPRGEQTVITSAVAGMVPPMIPPVVLIPGIPSVLRLPSVPAAPIGSTLGSTAMWVNPPTVSPITNAATRGAMPFVPNVDASANVFGADRLISLPQVIALVVLRP
jgi:tetratricopeptide (TPR) repeat protein